MGNGNSGEAGGAGRGRLGSVGKEEVIAGMLPLPSLPLPLSLCPSSPSGPGAWGEVGPQDREPSEALQPGLGCG